MSKDNRVALALAGLGGLSLFLPTLTAKANRIVAGESVYLLELSPLLLAAFVLAWAVFAFLAWSRPHGRLALRPAGSLDLDSPKQK